MDIIITVKQEKKKKWWPTDIQIKKFANCNSESRIYQAIYTFEDPRSKERKTNYDN